MLNLMVSSAILLIVFLFVGVGVLRGRKHHRTYAWIHLASLVLAVAVSAVASIFAARGLVNLALKLIPFGNRFQDVASESPLLIESIGALLAMLLAPGLFFVLFWIVKAIFGSVSRRVARGLIQKELAEESEKTAEKPTEPILEETDNEKETTEALAAEATLEKKAEETAEVAEVLPAEAERKPSKKTKKQKKFAVLKTEKTSPVGMLCGALCGLALCFVWLVPAVGPLSAADRMMDMVTQNSSSVSQTVGEIGEQVVGSAGVRIVRNMGGDAMYSLLTSQRVNGKWTDLSKESEVLYAVGNAVTAVRNTDVSRGEAAKQVRDVEDAFENAQLIPTLVSETLGMANEHWNRGEDFLGISKPSFGGSAMSDLLDATWNCLSDTDLPTLKQDVGTVVRVVSMLIEQDAWKTMTDNPLLALENQELSEPVIYELLANDHLRPLVGDMAKISLQTMGTQLGVDFSTVEFNTASIRDQSREAKAIANVFAKAADLLRYMEENPSTDGTTIRMIGPLLDALSATEMAGQQTSASLLKGLLESETIYTAMGYTKEEASRLAETVNAKANTVGYEPLMRSVGQMFEVVQLSAKDGTNNAEMDQKIQSLMQDLTPESASVLQTTATPSMMTGHGVPQQSAEPTASMISDLFGNLSKAKENGMSEEEYQSEAKATTNLLNLAMNTGSSENSSLFGSDSATGKTADEFIGEVFSSSVISQTMVETVYANGTESDPVVDPLQSQRTVNETEKQEILDALNNQWENATEEQKADSDYQKQYIAMGSMLNMSVQITASGIVAA